MEQIALFKIIERVHQKYPFVDLITVATIVNNFFAVIKEILLNGDEISMNGLFSQMKIISFKRSKNGKEEEVKKIKLKTSRKIKYGQH